MTLKNRDANEAAYLSGGMAEWFKAAVLKTVERKLRGFESYSLRHDNPANPGEMAESAEGARLLSECGGKLPPRVRIPLSPPANTSPGSPPTWRAIVFWAAGSNRGIDAFIPGIPSGRWPYAINISNPEIVPHCRKRPVCGRNSFNRSRSERHRYPHGRNRNAHSSRRRPVSSPDRLAAVCGCHNRGDGYRWRAPTCES